MSDGGESGSASGSKVGRLIARYGLDDMPRRLERYWQGDGVERRSLRELATRFNERLTRAAMEEAGSNPLDGEAANLYGLLTSEDASDADRIRAERRLERDGVDMDDLRDSFVSHQAIHTYLTSVRDQEYETQDIDVEERVETVQRLISRTRSVSADTVEALDRTGELTIGEFDVTADVRVSCRNCDSRYEISGLLQRGGCACRD